MENPFTGSEAVAQGLVTKSALRSRYTRVHPNVYVYPGTEMTPCVRAAAAWLWSGRKGVIAGLSASAVHGNRWVEATTPVELLHTNRNRLPGLLVRGDAIGPDEVVLIDGVPVTAVHRTALDVACWYPTLPALTAIDALLRATETTADPAAALVERYPGRRGIGAARRVLALADGGAQSPQETRVRLLLIEAGFPRPQTQIRVSGDNRYSTAYLDMGWEQWRIAVEYDGDHHRTDRAQYARDVRRLDMLQRKGWIVVRVLAGDGPADIVRRVRAACARRQVALV